MPLETVVGPPRERARITIYASLKTLFNFELPVTDSEPGYAAFQFVRKQSGFTWPSCSRVVEIANARERSPRRFPRPAATV